MQLEFNFNNITIPNKLFELGLYIAGFWTSIQFLFSSIDDFIEWKKTFLISEEVRPKSRLGDRTILIEIKSFSKGKIKHEKLFGQSYGGNIPEIPELREVKDGFDSSLKQLEEQIKHDIVSIERFKRWYKNYSYFTIFIFISHPPFLYIKIKR